ncbi:protein brambleberry-like isoform X2 [Diabrotica virgifera virgifera]|uniref:Protein brambleberry-like n=1 Tax=Diabrotica virgifera virgifera TaxID=50390 RepID=A0ABM5IFD0_DIAVI|nr:protein brambleberry-like isoform X1 [Diabrotica virgifera virgifera]XP_050513234.1 protein brambleberry-like isoform X2 [Diabrotica virgifera virgifera]
MKIGNHFYCLYLLFLQGHVVFGNWIKDIGTFLSFQQEQPENNENLEIYQQKIPYEISTADENFLKEAAKLTDLVLSELDSCQHRVILKLKSDCDKLNDEQLAKMAVHLLNCQSWVEGRPIYACTDEMSIKDCTISMDSDTWTSYHLMSNRARAVCYSIRQSQFRGLAEHTVNRLMEAAKNQLKNLGEITNTQQGLKDMTEKTYYTLKEGHRNLFEQQDDLKKAQFVGQLAIEDNIKRLADEKRLIRETHDNLVIMTRAVQEKLETSLNQLQDQTDESKVNHRELLNDLLIIQEKTKDIFEKIEKSSSLLIKQNEDFNRQYRSTFKTLQEMNKTVSDLVVLVKGTWLSLEERLTWIVAALGGTDTAIDRIYIIIWHAAFMLIAMLTCAFLAARPSTRFVVALLPPLNLAVALHGQHQYLDVFSLVGAIGSFVVAQTLIIWACALKPTIAGAIAWKRDPKISRSSTPQTSPTPVKTSYNSDLLKETLRRNLSKNDDDDDEDENADTFQDYNNMTPPASRNGDYFPRSASRSRSRTPLSFNTSLRANCTATTRAGTPCKLTTLPGRDLCYRHLGGSSVAG